MKIIIALLIFSFIIIFHEFGHYIVAVKNDVKVNEFMLGLGPKLFGFTKGETTFSLHLLPFGGACVMEGEDEASTDERAFNNKTIWQRIAIVFAGPFFNFILAYVMAIIILVMMGYDAPVVPGTIEGYPAEEAGMEEGDEIIALDNYKVHFYREVRVYTFMHSSEDITVKYKHEGKVKKATLTPVYDEESGSYLLGFRGPASYVKGNIFTTVKYGFYEIKYQIYVTLQSLKKLVTRQISVNQMSGPVGIVKTIGDTYDASKSIGWKYVLVNMLSISVLLSANLGVMNLLPIPALDGGRLLFFFIELIRGKQMDEEIEGRIHLAGFALLMLLMIVVLFNDIHKLF